MTPGMSWRQTQVVSLFYTMEAEFVPGTNPACPWDNPGTKGSRKSLLLKVDVAFSLAIKVHLNKIFEQFPLGS